MSHEVQRIHKLSPCQFSEICLCAPYSSSIILDTLRFVFRLCTHLLFVTFNDAQKIVQ